ncbi:MAG: hypothetical protein PHD51_01975 [Patescibacteria group bacterium]|nr:hypothetical protein [Patescibacteria group bacterium]MDD5490372.1 hypothetical protein [Patescibacteria group bacterium]
MIRPAVQIDRLIITSPRSRSTCYAFTSNITPDEKNSLGNLFGIIEINYQSKDSQKIINTIIAEMENAYYGTFNKLMLNQPAGATQLYLDGLENIETIFEESLQKINQKLTHLIKEQNLDLVPEKLNALIGVIKNKYLYFTNIGQTNAFLIHKKKNDDYIMLNVLEGAPSESERLNLIRIFSNIISGKINSEDSLLFCTSALLDYFSLEKLKTTLTTLTVTSALQQLKNLLNEANPNVSVAAIVAKLSDQREKPSNQPSKLTSQTSIAQLLGTEEKTKEFLSPSLLLNIRRNLSRTSGILNMRSKIFVKKLLEKIKEYKKEYHTARQKKLKTRQLRKQQWLLEQRKIEEEKKMLILEQSQKITIDGEEQKITADAVATEIIPELTEILPNKPGKIALLCGNVYGRLFKLAGFLKISFFNGWLWMEKTVKKTADAEKIRKFSPAHIIDNEKLKTKTKEFGEKFARLLYYLKFKFKQLPRTSQILLIITIVLGILFISSIAVLSLKQKSEESAIAYNDQLQEIENKKNAAEASIIYNDENKGRGLLWEAKKLVETLPAGQKKQRETKSNLLDELNVLLEKLRKVENISAPIVVADFKTVDPTIQLFKIIASGNKLFTFNPFNNVIYRLNLGAENTIDILKESSTSLGHLNLAINKNENTILFYRSNRSLVELNIKDNTLKDVAINLNNSSADIKEMSLYNNRLYLLDTFNRQIFRHNEALDGYARGNAWIKDETVNLDGLVSFAVDGGAYVLKNNGEILKFLSGYKQKFEPTLPDPAWANPSKLWTSAKSSYLYVLEPPEKRLLVFDKNGKLTVQYYSDKFNDLKDFTVDETLKKIYLLNGTQIYSINATHLK